MNDKARIVKVWKNGKLFTYENYTATEEGVVLRRKGKELKLIEAKGGYHSVSLYKNGVSSVYRVSRIIASTFKEKPEGKDIVLHKDNNVKNDSVGNIEWGTQSENIKQMYIDKRSTNSFKERPLLVKGEKHPLSKKIEQKTQEGILVKVWGGGLEIEESKEFSRYQVQACCSGRAKIHKGYCWNYL